MSPNPPTGADHKIKPVKQTLQARIFVPLLAELLPNIRQANAPRQRAGERVDDKTRYVHSRYAGRKSYEGANSRQQPAGEHNDLSVLGEPAISQIEIAM